MSDDYREALLELDLMDKYVDEVLAPMYEQEQDWVIIEHTDTYYVFARTDGELRTISCNYIDNAFGE